MADYDRNSEAVEAIQWDGTNQTTVEALLGETVTTYIVVKTDALGHIAEGSWIIKNSDGTFTVKSDGDFSGDYTATIQA